MPSVFEDTSQLKRKIKTPKRISLLIFFLLTYLMKSNLPIRTRSTKKTKITKEVHSAVEDKNGVAVMISLPQVSISFLKKKKKTFLKLSDFTISKKIITPSNVLRKKIQKTSVDLGNLYTNDCS